MSDQPANVIAALARVQADIGGIEKLTPEQRRKRGQGGGDERGVSYAYRGIDQIAAAAQPLFGKFGIVIVPEMRSYVAKEIQVNAKPWTDAELIVNWRVYGPGGRDDFIDARTVGLGRDNSDKAANKAMTGAYKNLLLRLLCIGDPDDDTDGHTHERDAVSPDDARARELGHDSYAHQVSRYENLRDATLALGTEDVKAWVKAQHITKNTLTDEQAKQWNARLNEIAAEQGASANQPESSGDYDHPVSAAPPSAAAVGADSPEATDTAATEPDPPATPPAGPSHQGAAEPSLAAAAEGEGGTRAKVGSKAADAAKKALAHAGMTEGEES